MIAMAYRLKRGQGGRTLKQVKELGQRVAEGRAAPAERADFDRFYREMEVIADNLRAAVRLWKEAR